MEKIKMKPKGKDKSKTISQEFDREHAIRILQLPNSQWELSEPDLVWNGQDIVKKKTEK